MESTGIHRTHSKNPLIPTITFISLRIMRSKRASDGHTRLHFNLPYAASVNITLYNCLGIEIETVFDQWRSSGTHMIDSVTDHLPKGTYFYRLRTNYDSTIKILTVE